MNTPTCLILFPQRNEPLLVYNQQQRGAGGGLGGTTSSSRTCCRLETADHRGKEEAGAMPLVPATRRTVTGDRTNKSFAHNNFSL